jgi:hypothetical protein
VYAVHDILGTSTPDVVDGLDGAPEAPHGLLQSPDLSDADLKSLADDAGTWSAGVSPPVVPEQPAAALSAPPLPPGRSPLGPPAVDRGWDPLSASPGIGRAPAPPEAPAVPGATSGPIEVAKTYSATGPDPAAGPPPIEPVGSVGPIGAAPRHQGTPDLGILSPLAGTVPAGGLLAWAQSASVSPGPAPPKAAYPPAPAAIGTVTPPAPPTPPVPVARLSPIAPSPVTPVAPTTPAPTVAAAWNALPAYPAVNGVGPATQARSTADGLRKLTRRVPGASLPEQDESLRRATPTTTNRNPLGLTGALAQYLSATANDGRAEKEQNSR